MSRGFITLNRLHVTFANWPSVVAVTAALVGSQSALQKEHSVGKIDCTTLVSYQDQSDVSCLARSDMKN